MHFVYGGRTVDHCGGGAQRMSPPKCQGKMSPRLIAMLSDYDTVDFAPPQAMGGRAGNP